MNPQTQKFHMLAKYWRILKVPSLSLTLFLSFSLSLLTSSLVSRSSVSSTWTTASAPGGRGAPVVIRHTPPDDTSTLGCRHEERIRDRVITESAPGVISLPSLQRSLDPELFSRLARQQLHNQPTTHQSSTLSYMLYIIMCIANTL